jgi:hypothetical protein
MAGARPDVRAFFQRYDRAARDLDTEALMSSFGEVFLSLEAIGSDGLELAEIDETPLDDLHTLVRTSWQLRMRDQAARDPVFLHSTFLLRKDDGAWRIALYLNHQDMARLFTELAGPGLAMRRL